MRRTQNRRRSRRRAWRRRLHSVLHACGMHLRAAAQLGARWLASRWSPVPPAVVVLGRQPGARRMRRTLSGAARAYARALGAALPRHTTIVVVPAVVEDRRFHGLVEVFDLPEGLQRAVIVLATRPYGQPISEDDLLAVLRQQVTRLLEASCGQPVMRLWVTLAAPEPEPGPSPAIIPLRPLSGGYRNGAVPQGQHGLGERPSIDQWPDDDPA